MNPKPCPVTGRHCGTKCCCADGSLIGETQCTAGSSRAECVSTALARCKSTANCTAVSLMNTAYQLWPYSNWSAVANSDWDSYAKNEPQPPPPIKTDDSDDDSRMKSHFSEAGSPVKSSNETIGDRLWLWSHPAGAYGYLFDGPPYNGWRSRITPVEAAMSMDIHNLLFIWEDQPDTQCVRGDKKKESCYPMKLDAVPDGQSALTQYLVPFRAPFMDKTAFSISARNVDYPTNYTEAIYNVLPTHGGFAGVVFDDFYPLERPEELALFKTASQEMKAQGKDVFLTVYEKQLTNLSQYLELADRPMFWTANVSAIADMEQNWGLLEAQMDLAGGRAKFKPMLGLYMWDYLTNKTDVPHELMEHQLSVGLKLLRSGRAHDLIFLGSTIVDFNLAGVQRSREWIAEYKNDPLVPPLKTDDLDDGCRDIRVVLVDPTLAL